MKITLNVLHNVYYILLNFSFSLKSTMLLAILQLVAHCWPKPDAAAPSKCTVASNNLWAFLISIFYQRISINQLKWIIFAHCHMRCKFKLIYELIKMLMHWSNCCTGAGMKSYCSNFSIHSNVMALLTNNLRVLLLMFWKNSQWRYKKFNTKTNIFCNFPTLFETIWSTKWYFLLLSALVLISWLTVFFSTTFHISTP